ncbi:hypothetical protein Cantr_06771 [Candida viswanathii]|uniref:Uncharacterized protein n=1 Tax=Candida viswanathii TaxID=5486 RepID=A0A367XV10_9ASCO|nr:hypothetical protein Cantr_06771 [Candida viswanathii]
MLTTYHLDCESLPDTNEYNDALLRQCHCDSCEYWRPLARTRTRDLFLGVIFPPLWLYNVVILINWLFFLNSAPLGTTEFLQIFNDKIRVEINVDSEEYSCLEDHREVRNDMWDCLGHILLGIAIEAFFIFGFAMAFSKSSVLMRQTDRGVGL